ncbi:MAG: hypothetical protein ACW98K_18070 [Candidatus Kariarchaeaceae archaeon]
MIEQDTVGWSATFLKSQCQNCQKENSIQIVQVQKKFTLGPLRLFGIGPRYFAKECSICSTRIQLPKSQIQKAYSLKFFKELIIHQEDRLKVTKKKKYPALSLKRREILRRENFKEGFYSASIGVGIGLILSVFWIFWGLLIASLSIFGGLYVALEDPERRHRGYLDKGKK